MLLAHIRSLLTSETQADLASMNVHMLMISELGVLPLETKFSIPLAFKVVVFKNPKQSLTHVTPFDDVNLQFIFLSCV
jgi:hypothetical protein